MKICQLCLPALLVLCSSSLLRGDHLVDISFPLTVAQTNPMASFPDGATLPSGLAMVQVDTNANTISWEVSYQNLTGPIIAPGAHFHGPASLGSNAGIEVFLTDGNPPEPATGTLMGSASLTDQQEMDVLAGLWYLNIHTEANLSGELRGQVVSTPIPEPSSAILLMGGLLAGALCRRPNQ